MHDRPRGALCVIDETDFFDRDTLKAHLVGGRIIAQLDAAFRCVEEMGAALRQIVEEGDEGCGFLIDFIPRAALVDVSRDDASGRSSWLFLKNLNELRVPVAVGVLVAEDFGKSALLLDFLHPLCGILEGPAEPVRVHMNGRLAAHEDIVFDPVVVATPNVGRPRHLIEGRYNCSQGKCRCIPGSQNRKGDANNCGGSPFRASSSSVLHRLRPHRWTHCKHYEFRCTQSRDRYC